LLAAFKYVPQLTFHILPSSLLEATRLALPLGISFWTFQALSYLFDLYRGEDLDPTFAEFALYMAFFPVTISGPVCRMPDASRQQSGMWSLMSRSRWFWLPAVYALALLVVLMITLTQQGGVGQMMYRSF